MSLVQYLIYLGIKRILQRVDLVENYLGTATKKKDTHRKKLV